MIGRRPGPGSWWAEGYTLTELVPDIDRSLSVCVDRRAGGWLLYRAVSVPLPTPARLT